MMFARLLTLLALTMLVALPVIAQEETNDDVDFPDVMVTFIGEVVFEEVDGETVIMIGGIIIAPASAFNPAFLEEGSIVEVTGVLLNDDTLRATAINFDPVIEDADDADDETLEDADDEDLEDADDETLEDAETGDRACVPDTHPVANRIAETFGVSVAEVIALHCDGYGFGNIARAYMLAEASDGDALSYLEQARDGGWGAVLRESGVHPADLAPGRMGRGSDAPGNSGNAPGNSGNAPGNSGNAPGNSGNAPGNSGNAPGRSGDAPGNSGNAPGNAGNAPGNAPGNSGNAPGGGGRGGGRP